MSRTSRALCAAAILTLSIACSTGCRRPPAYQELKAVALEKGQPAPEKGWWVNEVTFINLYKCWRQHHPE